MIEVKKAGRKVKIDEDMKKEMYLYAAKGLSIGEICTMCKISKHCFYNAVERDPDFKERIYALRDVPTIKAKLNIYDAICEKDINTSKWYLERKSPEFSNKSEMTVTQDVSIADRESALEEMLNSFIAKD